MASPEKTKIISTDFETFANSVATEVWNALIHEPILSTSTPAQYAELLGAIQKVLSQYQASTPTSGSLSSSAGSCTRQK